jgi:hypothetical protein
VPASVYAIVVWPVALVLGFGLRSARRRAEPAAVPAPAAPEVVRPVA